MVTVKRLIVLVYVLVNWSMILCQKTPVTYDLLLTTTASSVPTTDQAADKFLKTYSKAGLDKAAVLDRGRNAATWFLQKYGVDFTDIDPDKYLSGSETRYDGKVMFAPYMVEWPDHSPYRLVSAINHTDSAHFVNAPIRDLGWSLLFLEEFECSGELSQTVPQYGTGTFGDILIEVLMDCRENEKPFFPAEALENGLLRFQFQNAETTRMPQVGSQLMIIDMELYNHHYGDGQAQGVCNIENGDIRTVYRFPDRP